ncbi:hypothetical protein CIRG_01102 [Coccidioides immitis RMSCC 2394]|nr:hypothetical protein CIRG_01102 [Coccidioides immitis RMSCC 2394]
MRGGERCCMSRWYTRPLTWVASGEKERAEAARSLIVHWVQNRSATCNGLYQQPARDDVILQVEIRLQEGVHLPHRQHSTPMSLYCCVIQTSESLAAGGTTTPPRTSYRSPSKTIQAKRREEVGWDWGGPPLGSVLSPPLMVCWGTAVDTLLFFQSVVDNPQIRMSMFQWFQPASWGFEGGGHADTFKVWNGPVRGWQPFPFLVPLVNTGFTNAPFIILDYEVQLMDTRNKPISIHYCGRLNSGVKNAASRFPSIREPVAPVVLQTTDCPQKVVPRSTVITIINAREPISRFREATASERLHLCLSQHLPLWINVMGLDSERRLMSNKSVITSCLGYFITLPHWIIEKATRQVTHSQNRDNALHIELLYIAILPNGFYPRRFKMELSTAATPSQTRQTHPEVFDIFGKTGGERAIGMGESDPNLNGAIKRDCDWDIPGTGRQDGRELLPGGDNPGGHVSIRHLVSDALVFSFNTSQGCRAIPGLGPIEGDHWLKRIERRSAIIRFGEHRTIPVRLVAAQPGLYF